MDEQDIVYEYLKEALKRGGEIRITYNPKQDVELLKKQLSDYFVFDNDLATPIGKMTYKGYEYLYRGGLRGLKDKIKQDEELYNLNKKHIEKQICYHYWAIASVIVGVLSVLINLYLVFFSNKL